MNTIDLSLYTKLSKLGESSFSKEYKIKGHETDILYEASIFKSNFDALSDDEKRRTTNMINLIQNFNHPSILKFIGCSSVDFKGNNRITIVNELVANGSLCNIIDLAMKSILPPAWNDTKTLINLYGIASSMSYLHSHDILHLDLKPENVLLDDNLYPKLTDFYLATKISDLPITNVIGTPIYMAPEIVKNQEYSKACDVYSFALIVFELITYQKPYENINYFQLMLKISQGYRPKIPPQIPSSYKNLIESCWAEDPSKRPTFEEILKLLKSDKEFITDSVDEEEFLNYVDFIDQYPISYGRH